MCFILERLMPTDFYVSVPNRWKPGHPTEKYWTEGVTSSDRQLNWERKFLEVAALQRPGCIIF